MVVVGLLPLGHYVGKSEGQLRKAWQAVADFIEESARADSIREHNAVSSCLERDASSGTSGAMVQADPINHRPQKAARKARLAAAT